MLLYFQKRTLNVVVDKPNFAIFANSNKTGNHLLVGLHAKSTTPNYVIIVPKHAVLGHNFVAQH